MIKRPYSFRNIFPILTAMTVFAATALACGLGAPPELSGAGGENPAAQPEPVNTAMPEYTQVASASTSAPTPLPAQPSITETRLLTLEFPSKMRAGVEGDVVRLTLEVDDQGNITPTAVIEGNAVTGSLIEIPNLFDTHKVIAEASLDLAGMEVKPSEAVFEPLLRGQSATFFWSIRPQETGIYRGTVWLHLNFESLSTGEKSRIAVSAQIVEIEAVDFFGLSVNLARTGGVVGSIVGSVIGFPFLEEILKFIFRRRRRA